MVRRICIWRRTLFRSSHTVLPRYDSQHFEIIRTNSRLWASPQSSDNPVYRHTAPEGRQPNTVSIHCCWLLLNLRPSSRLPFFKHTTSFSRSSKICWGGILLSALMLCAPNNRRRPFSYDTKMADFAYFRVSSVFSCKNIDKNSEKSIEYGKYRQSGR